ncbi:MAG: protein kinase, partial [Gemmatimonadales bacterium]|nr:protein kinase [Gemmatimonadales bacterium]
DNILIDRATGRALVTDFGVARTESAPDGLTRVGEVVGTPQFMSPEQAAGEVLDGRSDLYALGVVGFFALTGRLPFEAPTTQALLAMHLTRPPSEPCAPISPRSSAPWSTVAWPRLPRPDSPVVRPWSLPWRRCGLPSRRWRRPCDSSTSRPTRRSAWAWCWPRRRWPCSRGLAVPTRSSPRHSCWLRSGGCSSRCTTAPDSCSDRASATRMCARASG